MSHREKALVYFSKKLHCSQAVLAAYAPELGLSEQQTLKLAACFGSGMRKGEVCGACTGALMVLGMLYGHSDSADTQSKQRADEVGDSFLERFSSENGSYLCRELLGCDVSAREGVAYAIEHNLFCEFCPKMVASAVDIVEGIISEQNAAKDAKE